MRTTVYLTFGLFLLTCLAMQAQDYGEEVKVLDVNLENYEYPFPVSSFKLYTQQQSLTMAYMYLKAENPNGKTITLLHGKNFNGA